MLNKSKLSYTTHHDNGYPVCLVGNTELNKEVYNVLKNQKDCKLMSIEEFNLMSQDFIDSHQYFTASGNTAFKLEIINTIKSKNKQANFISLVSDNAVVHQEATVGKGTLICPTAYIGGPSELKDFVIIQHFSQIGHSKSTLNDHVYVSPMSTVVNCNLAEGSWIGMYNNFAYVETVPFQQFVMYSRVLKQKFIKSGTYKHDKLIDKRNCLQHYIA